METSVLFMSKWRSSRPSASSSQPQGHGNPGSGVGLLTGGWELDSIEG